MLDKLFGSKTRAQLLNLFFSSPESAFYIRQIARNFETHTNSVRRELNNLVEIGALEELDEATSKQTESDNDTAQSCKYYKVNTDFIIYPELKSLFAKAQLLVRDRLIKELDTVGKINLLILTGNFTNTPNVQTDILLVGQIKKDKLKKVINQFEKEIGKDIFYTVMSKTEFEERRNLTDCFIFDILTSPKLVLIDTLKITHNES
ncbi:MAG: hypothetical protein WCX88_00570 [Patescibacteria group bacterium]